MNVKYDNLEKWCKQNNKERLLDEWDYSKNNSMSPCDFTAGSSKKVWWKCDKGHSWQAVVSSRTFQNHGCIYCSNQKALAGFNDFETWCFDNGKAYLVNEWDYDLNEKEPTEYTWCSGIKVFWKCNKGHGWRTSIAHRVSENTGCPICSNRIILAGYNDLMTLRPDIAKEWHPTKNGNLTPKNVGVGSKKKVWWMCDKGHEWQAVIYSRAGKASNGCAVCSGKRLLTGENDLETYCNTNENTKHLLDEWDYEKNQVLPSQVTAHCDRMIHWKCKNGHKWIATVSSRVRGNGCRYCSAQTSFPEQAVYFYINKIFPDSVSRYVFDKSELDVFIPTIKVGIEYDGFFYHQGKELFDHEKNKKCLEQNIKLIRIREEGLCDFDDCICIERKQPNVLESLNNVITELFKLLNAFCDDVDIVRDERAIIEQYKTYIQEKSVIKSHPDLVLDWDEKLNGGLKLENFTKCSHFKANWKCHVCGHQWKAEIKSRANGNGCKICGRKRTVNAKSIKVKNDNTGIVYESLTEAERKTGVERHSISDCCKGLREKAGDYHWSFV